MSIDVSYQLHSSLNLCVYPRLGSSCIDPSWTLFGNICKARCRWNKDQETTHHNHSSINELIQPGCDSHWLLKCFNPEPWQQKLNLESTSSTNFKSVAKYNFIHWANQHISAAWCCAELPLVEIRDLRSEMCAAARDRRPPVALLTRARQRLSNVTRLGSQMRDNQRTSVDR